MRKVLATLILMATLVCGAARASHYAVTEVPRLITPAQVDKLHKAGVNTTDELLDKAAKSKDRKALAKASGLRAAELLALAQRCDLLRIKGVGSEMVLLLEAAGVKSTADLAKQEPAELMTAVTNANQKAKITEKPPTEPQLADWIEPGQAAAAGGRCQVEAGPVGRPRPAAGRGPGPRSSKRPGRFDFWSNFARVSDSACPPHVTPSPSRLAGQIPAGATVGGRFRIDGLLYQDSVSQTYRATDLGNHGAVALRIIPMRVLGTAPPSSRRTSRRRARSSTRTWSRS